MKRKTDLTEEQVLMIMNQYRIGVDSRETASFIGCSQPFISTIVKAFNGSTKKLDLLAKDLAELIKKLSPFYLSDLNSTSKEQEALDLTGQLWNKIIELDVLHQMDNQEHCRDIHNIQNRIQARIYKRKNNPTT
jgi:hypothetical protein